VATDRFNHHAGVVIPVSVLLLVLILTVTIVMVKRRNMDRDWEISYDELDVHEQLGVRDDAPRSHSLPCSIRASPSSALMHLHRHRHRHQVGGYGEVYKAVWKGTEVAVKVIASGKINKGMENNFKQEVRPCTTANAASSPACFGFV
jgi:hypothetical protein